jgi:predicted phage terminase large subunit-like protein
MIMQRLHEDDPTGNLLQDGGYTHVKLPAQAVGAPVMISLKGKNWQMKQNELLFPQRLTADSLEEKRRDLQEYNYVGQYLQEPVPLGGGEFKDTWLNYYGNGETKPKEMNIYITCDPAGGEELQKKKKKLSDFTCFMVIGLHTDNNYYLLDAVRDRLNPTERVDKLFELHKTWSSLSGKPPKVGYEKYGLMTDTHYIREKQKQIGYRFQLIELGGSMSKEERVRRIIPDLQHGRWWFPSGLLYTDYEGKTLDLMRELVKSEMASFPKARYDDMLDALTRIYDDELQAIFPFVKKPKARTKSQSYGHFLDF